VRFLILCSRAPPIRINSLLTDVNFGVTPNEHNTLNFQEGKDAGPKKITPRGA